MSGLHHTSSGTTRAESASRPATSRSSSVHPPATRLLSVVAGSLAFLVMTAVLLCSRRLAGGIPADLPALVAVVAAGLSGAAAVVCCGLLREHSPAERQVHILLLATVLCGGLSLATGAALLPAGSTFGLAALLIMAPAWSVTASLLPGVPLPGIASVPGATAPAPAVAAATEAAAPHAGEDGESLVSAQPGEPLPQSAGVLQAESVPPAETESAPPAETVPFPDTAVPAVHSLEDNLLENSLNEQLAGGEYNTADCESADFDESQVLQWTRRLRDTDGTESIVGSVRTLFPAGQRTHAVHLVFSPPLAGAPQIECETSADAEIRCKVASAMPWGARIELRRSLSAAEQGTPAAAEPVELEYFVSTTRNEAA